MWIQQFLLYLSSGFDPSLWLFVVCLPSCKDHNENVTEITSCQDYLAKL